MMWPMSTATPQHYPSLPPVTDAYRKAHKNYVLSAALLGSWQLIGITIETKEKWGVSLKSPAAVPVILFVLVVYFGYRMTVEWLQCDEGRRMHRIAVLDYRVAHAIAAVSVSIAIIQYVFERQVIDIVNHYFPAWAEKALLVGFMLGAAISFASYFFFHVIKYP